MKKILSCLAVVACSCGTIPVSAETITVGSAPGQPGQSVVLPITVDDPGNIAGAVFTLTYNSSYFTLTAVRSTFFETFTNQWQTLSPAPNPLPAGEVIVDGTRYDTPLLVNTSADTALVAAARVKAGAAQSTLFTLHFSAQAAVPDGAYPVSISRTVISDTAAGYPAAGEYLPILIGAVEGERNPALAYPAISPSVINGMIMVNTSVTDSDGDGIDDAWENAQFGNLTSANALSDYDQDGYTDRQEYLNWIAGETDPEDADYDPRRENAPGGTGYNGGSTGGSVGGSLWNLMLPAILSGAR